MANHQTSPLCSAHVQWPKFKFHTIKHCSSVLWGNFKFWQNPSDQLVFEMINEMSRIHVCQHCIWNEMTFLKKILSTINDLTDTEWHLNVKWRWMEKTLKLYYGKYWTKSNSVISLKFSVLSLGWGWGWGEGLSDKCGVPINSGLHKKINTSVCHPSAKRWVITGVTFVRRCYHVRAHTHTHTR